MTLNEALAIICPWLGTWLPSHVLQSRDSLTGVPLSSWQPRPMPPATDELAMQVLRKLKAEQYHVWFRPDGACQLTRKYSSKVAAISEAADPRDAIIIAAASWLQNQEKQTE